MPLSDQKLDRLEKLLQAANEDFVTLKDLEEIGANFKALLQFQDQKAEKLLSEATAKLDEKIANHSQEFDETSEQHEEMLTTLIADLLAKNAKLVEGLESRLESEFNRKLQADLGGLEVKMTKKIPKEVDLSALYREITDVRRKIATQVDSIEKSVNKLNKAQKDNVNVNEFDDLEDRVEDLEEKIKKIKQGVGNGWWGGVGAIKEIIAGDNITVDNSNPQYPIVTANLPAGSGITRSIVLTSGNVTMAATSSTDYVYIVTGAHTITLPTAVGNTNLYTVRNNHTANITVNTTSSQNIKGAVTATSYSLFSGDSRDFISDDTGWNIV